MKKLTTILAILFLVFCVSWPAMAQQQSPQDLTDKTVRNEQGEEIGDIIEVIPAPDGSIEAVIVKKGGFLGIGGAEERIPWNALREGDDPDSLVYAPGRMGQAQQEQARVRDQRAQTSAPEQQEQSRTARQEQPAQGRQQSGQDREEQAGGEITVQQPAPKVAVEQGQPRVQVEQPEAQVQVEQPPPQVTVRQPPPEIDVQVHQPKPQVDVKQPQPRVGVEQPQPQVRVEQPEPEVRVQQQEPEVTVKKGEPQVQIDKSGEPEVYVEKQKQAEVQVQREGEPQVRITQEPQKPGQTVDASKTGEWLDRKVVDQDGKELGTVQYTYLSEDGNSILYVIVQGEENQMHPIPVTMVREDKAQEQLVAEIDKQTFDRSPSFSGQQAPKLDEQPWSRQIRSYYQMEGQRKPGSGGVQQQQDQQTRGGAQQRNQQAR